MQADSDFAQRSDTINDDDDGDDVVATLLAQDLTGSAAQRKPEAIVCAPSTLVTSLARAILMCTTDDWCRALVQEACDGSSPDDLRVLDAVANHPAVLVTYQTNTQTPHTVVVPVLVPLTAMS